MLQAKRLMLLAFAGFGLAEMVTHADASVITVSLSPTGAPSGAIYDNLNSVTAGPAVTFTGPAGYVTGASPNNYAQPFLANNIGAPFGDANGPDTSQYIAVRGTGSATIQFSSPQTYFGLLWGSVDNFNTLSFYNGSTFVGSVAGTDVDAKASGDQGAKGTYYVNLNSSLAFNEVVASSTQNSFEFDDLAFSQANPPVSVPEPSTLMVLGSGIAMIGIIARRRRGAAA